MEGEMNCRLVMCLYGFIHLFLVSLYTNFGYNVKTHYVDSLNGTNPQLKIGQVIRDIHEYGIKYSKKSVLGICVKIAS